MCFVGEEEVAEVVSVLLLWALPAGLGARPGLCTGTLLYIPATYTSHTQQYYNFFSFFKLKLFSTVNVLLFQNFAVAICISSAFILSL